MICIKFKLFKIFQRVSKNIDKLTKVEKKKLEYKQHLKYQSWKWLKREAMEGWRKR